MLAMFSIVSYSPDKSSCPKLYALGLSSVEQEILEKYWMLQRSCDSKIAHND